MAPVSMAPALGQQVADQAGRCTALVGQRMGEVEITAATFHPQGRSVAGPPGRPAAAMAPHCWVQGTINRRVGAGGVEYGIGFELALPVAWNGRYLLMGGGGLNGSIRPPSGPVAAGTNDALSRGFAVASHDSGHKGAGFDQSFFADQRAALDFAETSVRTVTLATRDIVQGYFGSAPHHSYMTGCSTGGREGMLASQRYPELFDGIVIGAPAMRPGRSNLGIEWAQVLLNRTQAAGISTPAGITPVERRLIDGELRRQCDGADGHMDGMIMNVEACRSFDPAALSCPAGQTEGCIAPERVAALATAFGGLTNSAGRREYVPIPWDTGITFTGPGLPGYLPAGAPGPFGPASAAREIDIDDRLHAVDWDAAGRLTDTAYWTNLSTFLGRGAKVMYFHGVSDPWFSAFDTWDYFQRARATNGAESWDNAARFYMVPGMMHCSGGNAFETFDLLGPMVDWVEQGTAPAAVTATRSTGSAGEMPQEMPLCPHPSYAHYQGGDAALASSYTCRQPAA
jgi:feruloyl esterase